MKKIALMVLAVGVTLGLALTAEARGWGYGCRGNTAVTNVSARGYGPGSCPGYSNGVRGYGVGNGRGYGPGFNRGYGPSAPPAPNVPGPAGK